MGDNSNFFVTVYHVQSHEYAPQIPLQANVKNAGVFQLTEKTCQVVQQHNYRVTGHDSLAGY